MIPIQHRHSREDFSRFYRTYLEDELIKIEEKRQVSYEKIKQYKKRTIILIILYTLFVPALLMIWSDVVFLGYLLIWVFSYIVPYQKQKKQVLAVIKNNLITEIVRFLDWSFQYEPTRYISQEVFNQANFYVKGDIDIYGGDDYIHGKVGETSIEFSEVHALKKVGSGDNERTVTLFKGLFFIIDFHKPFQGSVYAVPKSEKRFSYGGIKKTNNDRTRLEEATLENPIFSNHFLVRTSDQVLARYLFTPAFMEHMLRFQESAEGDVLFSFHDGKMYLGIKSKKDHFDIQMDQPLSEEILYEYFEDVKIAFDIVEELNLNTRIWG